MIFDHGVTAVRLRRQLIKADHGNATVLPSWDDPDHPPEEVEIKGVAVAPGSGMFSTRRAESLEREQSISSVSLYGPSGIDIKVGDRVRVNGVMWEVSGEPHEFTNPITGWEAGTETPLESVRG